MTLAPAAVAAALGIGLLVGLERERKKGDGPQRAAAGMRTFTVTALLGYLAMALGQAPLLGLTLIALVVLLGIVYVINRDDDPGITTEVALMLTLLLGGLCVVDAGGAVALGVVLTVLLAYRSLLHDVARKYLSEAELRDGLLLASAAMVVLPLVPDQNTGPFGAINFHTLWQLTVLMMAIGAAGHVARRLLGQRRGLALTGLASGFVSSTATIASMGGLAQRDSALLRPACAGALLSALATPVQMGLMLATVHAGLFRLALLPLLAGGAAALAYAVFFLRGAGAESAAAESSTAPSFGLRAALLLVLAIAGISLLSATLLAFWGERGLTIAAALGGLVDAHSSVISIAAMAAAGKAGDASALCAILFAITSNTIARCLVARSSGGPAFARRVIPGLLLTLAAIWGAALLSEGVRDVLAGAVFG